MPFIPHVDWSAALAVARRWPGDLPDVTRPEAAILVADLRQQARWAARVASRTMGVPPGGAGTVRVVDREGWVSAAAGILQSTMDRVSAPAQPEERQRLHRRIVASGLGSILGIGFGVGSKWMLGQYDSLTGGDTLYFVAPNILAFERRLGFAPRDFRRWVAVHEQTHALQFRAAPWLADHLIELATGSESRASRDAIVATMTFLEGHADYVSDHTGRIRTAARMRRQFRSARAGSASLLNKAGQYADGRHFCIAVRRLSSKSMLSKAFERPEHLPTRREIADPAGWLARVGG